MGLSDDHLHWLSLSPVGWKALSPKVQSLKTTKMWGVVSSCKNYLLLCSVKMISLQGHYTIIQDQNVTYWCHDNCLIIGAVLDDKSCAPCKMLQATFHQFWLFQSWFCNRCQNHISGYFSKKSSHKTVLTPSNIFVKLYDRKPFLFY